jgi:hypothetical protein
MASVVAADLVAYHAATQSDVDGSTVGGAIDTLRRPDFTQIAANDTIQALSSAAGDTAITVTMTGRSAAGSIVTETKTLTGTTAITFNTLGTVERVLQAELSAAAAGTITIQRTTGAVLIRTIPIGERGFSAIFRKGSSSSTSGTRQLLREVLLEVTRTRRTHCSARRVRVGGPVRDVITTWPRRFRERLRHDDEPPNGARRRHVRRDCGQRAGNRSGATAAIGVWLNMTLATNNAAIRSTYTSQISGSTT